MIGFNIPELIVESLIRDGLLNIKSRPEIIDDLFSQLTKGYNRKYGQAELDKIKAMVQKDIAVVYSYSQVDAQKTTISIMVGSDTEDKPRARLGDYEDQLTEQIVDSTKLAALVKVDNIQVISYDPLVGKVLVDDSTDLSAIHKNLLFVDADGETYNINGGIDVTPGNKSFLIDKQLEPDLSDVCSIKSSLDYEVYEVRGVTGDVNLTLGVHSKDVLTTKYLYVLLKYFILSRKKDMIKRGLFLATYSGSDFNRNQEYLGDQIYHRFLTITGKVEETWRADQVVLIDDVEIDCEPVE